MAHSEQYLKRGYLWTDLESEIDAEFSGFGIAAERVWDIDGDGFMVIDRPTAHKPAQTIEQRKAARKHDSDATQCTDCTEPLAANSKRFCIMHRQMQRKREERHRKKRKGSMARTKMSTTVYIDPEQDRALKKLNQRTKVPVAEYIRQGINLVLAQHRKTLAAMEADDHGGVAQG